MFMRNSNITLQINLSPGDIEYAHITVPALIDHHDEAGNILLTVDICKPQSTKLVNRELRFPEPLFSEKTDKIVKIAEQICARYDNCTMYVLKPDDAIIKTLGDKYLNGWYYNTHDYGGCANMGYWLGFELPETQYVLHYDADILLYQEAGYKWTTEAIELMKENKHAIASCPRYNTPFDFADESPSYKHCIPFEKSKDCWLDAFFSTHCLLIDKHRFEKYLPLMTGLVLLETLAVKYLNRGYPRSPEIVMLRKIGKNKGRRLILNSFKSWVMHPHSKPPAFIEHLPQILDLVTQGKYPANHTEENIELEKWIALVKQHEIG